MQECQKSDAEKVRDFTELSMEKQVPSKPSPMNYAEVEWILKMTLSELVEFAQTVTATNIEACDMVVKSVKIPDSEPVLTTPLQIASHQAGVAEIWVHMHNMFNTKRIYLNKIFNLVHEANMAKVDPKTGRFIRRDCGKVLKPPGWKPADVEGEISKQLSDFPRTCGNPLPEINISSFDAEFVENILQPSMIHLVKLAQTVNETNLDAYKMVINCIGVDMSPHPNCKSLVEIAAAQADAAVDTWYYILNAFAKKGVNLSYCLNTDVHAMLVKQNEKGSWEHPSILV